VWRRGALDVRKLPEIVTLESCPTHKEQQALTASQAHGRNPKATLDNNDATAFFAATGDLLLTGPTLTNVNNVRVILVERA